MINSRPAAKTANVSDDRREAIRSLYMESLQLVERLHRRLLDVIKDEFDRNGRSDINAIQALLLFNIGNSELTAGELRSRGYYLGSNVSYNLKKLVDLGFINHQRSRIDRRSVRVSLTEKGAEVAEVVDDVRRRDEARFELQLAGNIQDGRLYFKGNMNTPVPAPVAQPRQPGRALSEETAGVLNTPAE